MTKIRFAEAIKVLPVLAAQDIAATAAVTSFVDLSLAHWLTFVCQFGAITVTDTGLFTISVEASTSGADTDTETNIGYSYRISNAIGAAYSMGTITAVDSTATTTIASTDVASSVLIIEVDPQAVAGTATARYVRFTIDGAADVTAALAGVVAYVEPRYPGNSMPDDFTST